MQVVVDDGLLDCWWSFGGVVGILVEGLFVFYVCDGMLLFLFWGYLVVLFL